jgi:uncharacterized BrkB/YihY/UPF0761 family membrane protein
VKAEELEARPDEARRAVKSAPPGSDAPPASHAPSAGEAPSTEEPSVLRPRGLLVPPLEQGAPRGRRVVRALHRLVQGLYVHQAFKAAPAMAFHFFLSLLPLFVFVGYVVGRIAQKHGVETVLWPVLGYLPDDAAGLFKSELDRMGDASTLGPLAAVGFLWLASGGTHGLMDALETAIGAPRRPWWKKRVLAGAWVLGSLVAVTIASLGVVKWDAFIHPPDASVAATAASAAPDPSSASSAEGPNPADAASAASAPSAANAGAGASPSLRTREHAHRERSPLHHVVSRRRVKLLRDGGQRALALLATSAFCVLALAGFYRFSVSHPRRVRRRVVPGAVLAVGLGLVISWGFGLYVRSLTDYAVFYGSLAAVAVLLVWLWLASLAILVGAEMNAQLEGLRD